MLANQTSFWLACTPTPRSLISLPDFYSTLFEF